MAEEVVLVVEDEAPLRNAVCEFLSQKGMRPLAAGNCAQAEFLWKKEQPDIAILDYELPDGDALSLMPRLQAVDPHTPLVILTGHGSIQLAVDAIKQGAEQFLTKPAEMHTLLMVIERCLDNHRNRQQQIVTRTRIRRDGTDPFLGASAGMRHLAEMANRVLNSNSPVLIQGETGTGKGILARWLHQNGARASRPFIDLNCGGLSRDLLETELFGHEKGSFTGAVQTKTGLLEIGHKGTVFLDEIGDMDMQVQPKLLKVLEDKTFRRLGGTQERMVDVRLIAATHHDLRRMAQEKMFREDLYFRVSTITLHVPPLRERVEDIAALSRSLLDSITSSMGMTRVEIDPETLRSLETYSWPGNVRELKNILERAVLLGDQKMLLSRDLHFDINVDIDEPLSAVPQSPIHTLEEMEKVYIGQMLQSVGGRVAEAAKRLGIPRSSLYHKLKQYRITQAEPAQSRPEKAPVASLGAAAAKH